MKPRTNAKRLAAPWLALAICFFWGSPQDVSAQEPPNVPPIVMDPKKQREVDRTSEKVDREIREQEEFMVQYVKLPPQERVQLWKSANERKNRHKPVADSGHEMKDALIVAGTDAVPYLAEVVSTADIYYRISAVQILCEMDRFVPKDQLLIPEWGYSYYVKPLKMSGLMNRYVDVDGRRIGKEGYEAVKWAAELPQDSAQNRDLRFHARECSGLLDRDLRQLSFDEQFRQWKELSIRLNKKRGPHQGNPDDSLQLSHLEKAIQERPVEQLLPPLIEMLDSDPDPHLQGALIDMIWRMDRRTRLRATELGRRAIEAMRKAIVRGHIKGSLPQELRKKPPDWWKEITASLYEDQIDLSPLSGWAFMGQAFEKLYGGTFTHDYNRYAGRGEAIPEFRQFVTYLTKVDPFYPTQICRLGWGDQVLRPDFKEMTDRCYQHWQRFKAEQASSARPSEQPPQQ